MLQCECLVLTPLTLVRVNMQDEQAGLPKIPLGHDGQGAVGDNKSSDADPKGDRQEVGLPTGRGPASRDTRRSGLGRRHDPRGLLYPPGTLSARGQGELRRLAGIRDAWVQTLPVQDQLAYTREEDSAHQAATYIVGNGCVPRITIARPFLQLRLKGAYPCGWTVDRQDGESPTPLAKRHYGGGPLRLAAERRRARIRPTPLPFPVRPYREQWKDYLRTGEDG